MVLWEFYRNDGKENRNDRSRFRDMTPNAGESKGKENAKMKWKLRLYCSLHGFGFKKRQRVSRSCGVTEHT